MQHIAMIMDGNRRWAQKNKLRAIFHGHRKGIDSITTAVKFCLNHGVKHLSLFTFSLENFRRPEEEKHFLFGQLATEAMKTHLPKLIEQGVRIRFIGDRTLFPQQMDNFIETCETQTQHNNRLSLNFMFCYGGQQELIYATKQVAHKVKAGQLSADDIDEHTLRGEFWLTDTPDPDLIIRTGGRARLSNFLLFQGAYSEWKFLDCYWPEITEDILLQCVSDFSAIQRNFGK